MKKHKHNWKYGGIAFVGMYGVVDEYCDCGATRRRAMHEGILD
jgi:hypothetical protein